MRALALLLVALLAGCQTAPSAPEVDPRPPVDEVRLGAGPFGPMFCWRTPDELSEQFLPGDAEGWLSLCAPAAALMPCRETPEIYDCALLRRQHTPPSRSENWM